MDLGGCCRIHFQKLIYLYDILSLNISFRIVRLMFKESNIHRSVESFHNWAIAFVPFLVWRVGQEYTLECFGVEFTSILLVDMDKY